MEQTLFFLIVENGVVVNRVIGSTSYMGDNVFPQPEGPDVEIGSTFVESRNLYLPPNVTLEELDSKVSEDLPKLEEKQTFYKKFVESDNFKQNITEDLKKQTTDYLESINRIVDDVKKNPLWILSHQTDFILSGEPFKIRPNLDNEV